MKSVARKPELPGRPAVDLTSAAMDTASVTALIAGLSGVGGAVVGAGATIFSERWSRKAERRRDHDDALVAYWTAVASFVHLWGLLAEVVPPTKNFFEQALQGLRISGFAAQLVSRQFSVADAFWHASGRVRAVATAADLEVVNAIEGVVAAWTLGDPMPEAFGPELRRLRELVEDLADDRTVTN